MRRYAAAAAMYVLGVFPALVMLVLGIALTDTDEFSFSTLIGIILIAVSLPAGFWGIVAISDTSPVNKILDE